MPKARVIPKRTECRRTNGANWCKRLITSTIRYNPVLSRRRPHDHENLLTVVEESTSLGPAFLAGVGGVQVWFVDRSNGSAEGERFIHGPFGCGSGK